MRTPRRALRVQERLRPFPKCGRAVDQRVGPALKRARTRNELAGPAKEVGQVSGEVFVGVHAQVRAISGPSPGRTPLGFSFTRVAGQRPEIPESRDTRSRPGVSTRRV